MVNADGPLTTAIDQPRWLAALFLVAALWALAPQTALAHGDHGHESPPTRAHGQDAAGAHPASAALHASSLSPTCPAGSGKTCGCDSLIVLSSAEKLLLNSVARDVPAVLPAARAKYPALELAAPSTPSRFFASPRAPPFRLIG